MKERRSRKAADVERNQHYDEFETRCDLAARKRFRTPAYQAAVAMENRKEEKKCQRQQTI